MAGWDIYDRPNDDATAGGAEKPPARVHCAACNRKRELEDTVIETNERTGAYGFRVCYESHEEGGCFEGPYPDLQKPEKTDDVSPIPNLYY